MQRRDVAAVAGSEDGSSSEDESDDEILQVDESLPPLPPPPPRQRKFSCRKDLLSTSRCRELIGSNPAIEYPFNLDTFQLMAGVLNAVKGPWSVGGEWGCTPDELRQTGLLK